MKILILGGTRFLGRAFVEKALNRGHEVTLFNRGTNKEIFPEVEQLIGDRNGDVSSLENRKWDVVVDTCGFSPHHIRNVEKYLKIIFNTIYSSQAFPYIKIGFHMT